MAGEGLYAKAEISEGQVLTHHCFSMIINYQTPIINQQTPGSGVLQWGSYSLHQVVRISFQKMEQARKPRSLETLPTHSM